MEMMRKTTRKKMKDKIEFRLDIFPLTVIFVLLKLFGAIDWSWWWVFSPLWIPYSVVCAFAVIMGIRAAITSWKENDR